MKKLIIVGLLGLLVLSCKKKVDMDLELTLIHQGALYGNGDENISNENFVIKKEEDWQELLDKINAVNNESDNFYETEIDFDEFIILACFDKVRSSAGYSISISAFEVKNNAIIFTVSTENPEGMVSAVITQPYSIAKIPKTNKKITFTE